MCVCTEIRRHSLNSNGEENNDDTHTCYAYIVICNI